MSTPSPQAPQTGNQSADGASKMPPSRRRRAAKATAKATGWSVIVLIVLGLVAVVALIAVLANLDNPTVSDWVQNTANDEVGLELEYEELSVSPFSGVHARNLRIRTPEPYTPYAPYLLELGQLDVSWDFWSFTSDKPVVTHVKVVDLAIHEVADQQGGSSINTVAANFASAEPPPEEPAAPLSRLITEGLPAFAVEDIDIRGVSFELINVSLAREQVLGRTQLDSLCLNGPLRAAPGVLDAKVHLGGCGDDDQLAVRIDDSSGAPDARSGEISLRLSTDLRSPKPNVIDISVESDLFRQTLMPEAELPEELTRVKLTTTFEADKERTSVRLDASLLDGAVTSELIALLEDRPEGALAPVVEQLSGAIDGDKLFGYVSSLAPGVSIADTGFTYEITDLALDDDGSMIERGDITLSGQLGEVRIAQPAVAATGIEADGADEATGGADAPQPTPAGTDNIAVDKLSFNLTAALRAPLGGNFHSTLSVDRLEADMAAGEQAKVAGVKFSATGEDLGINLIDPLRSRGVINVTSELAEVDVAQAESSASVRDLAFKNELVLAERIAVSGSLPIDALSMKQGPRGPEASVGGLTLSWQVRDVEPVSLQAALDQAALGAAAGAPASAADADGADGEGEPTTPSADAPAAPAPGPALAFADPIKAEFGVKLDRANLRDRGQRVALDKVGLEVSATARSLAQFDAAVDIPLGRVEARTGDGMAVNLRGANIGLRADDVEFDLNAPDKANARIRVTTSLPELGARMPEMRIAGRRIGLTMQSTVRGGMPRSLTGSLPIGKLDVRDLTAGEDLVRLDGGKLGWDVSRLALNQNDPTRSNGDIKLTAALPNVELPNAKAAVAIPSLSLDLGLRGARQSYDAKLRMALDSLAMDGTRHDTRLLATATARANLRQPAVDVDFGVHSARAGGGGPDIDAKLSAAYTRGQQQLAYDFSLLAENLAKLEEFLPDDVRAEHRVDWPALRIDVAGKGQVAGLIRRFQGGTTPIIADDPMVAARGQQQLRADITGLDYRGPDQRVEIPQLTLDFTASKTDAINAKLDLATEHIGLESAGDVIAIDGLTQTLRLTSQDAPDKGLVTLNLETDVKRVVQPFIGYPVEDTQLRVRGSVDKLASLRLDQLKLENPAGGTYLEAQAAADMITPENDGSPDLPGRQALALSGYLKQNLSRVTLPDGPRMRGNIEFPFEVESGDLTAFQLALRAKLDDVHVTLPEDDISVQGFDGNIPIVANVALMPNGQVLLLEGPGKNLYSRTRFLDVHPFLRGQHFLTIDKVRMLEQDIGPIAGNLRFQDQMLALDQLQVGLFGGNISGQLIVDIQNQSPRMSFKGNATGLRFGEDDQVLDANASISFVPASLALAGSVQIVRMSRQHLMAMLDFIDPYRKDVDVNRARLGLQAGYPEYMQIRMRDGFLSAKLDLGGVAGAVRLDPIEGIALGPLLELYVAPYIDLDMAALMTITPAESDGEDSDDGPLLEEAPLGEPDRDPKDPEDPNTPASPGAIDAIESARREKQNGDAAPQP